MKEIVMEFKLGIIQCVTVAASMGLTSWLIAWGFGTGLRQAFKGFKPTIELKETTKYIYEQQEGGQ